MKIFKFPALLTLAGLAACTQQPKEKQSTSEEKTEKHSQPNIVLIMADDVAPQHLGCYGGKIPTPHLDRLAGEGMKFNRAYAPSSACTPSRYGIMTGQYPGRCTSDEFIEGNPVSEPYLIAWNTPITAENTTIHKILSQAGYYTGYVGKFHIGPLEFDNPESNEDIPDIDPALAPDTKEADSLLATYQKVISDKVRELSGCHFTASIQWENPEGIPIKAVARHNLEWTTNGAVEFLQKASKQDKPFFLHLNSTALHGPNHIDDLRTDAHFTPGGRTENPYEYHPPRSTIFERLDKAGIPYENIPNHKKHYHTGIIYMDDQVGAILKQLDDMKISDNTIVIYTADHSTEPGKSSCYEKGLKVPFLVRWPQTIQAGTENNELVQFVDFLPTFASLAGHELPDDVTPDGVDFSPAFNGQPLDREYLYSEMGYLRSIFNEKYKYIAMRFPEQTVDKLQSGDIEILCHLGREISGFASIVSSYFPGYFDADQLYHLDNDPYEQHNLAYKKDYADIKNNMQGALKNKLNTFRHPYYMKDTSFMNLPEYKAGINKAKEKGISVPWWDRNINFPPDSGEVFYF